ncbi:MAG: pyridoxamine 5'-phosphate oxidase family protein [Clostridiales bacterium]|jgi:uncharacterized pyridoxamine 5'-phosphate oxidase family protein|nr:pyridoxamine 5'-phosphate oxidase family protein [Clostridiales bacterium]
MVNEVYEYLKKAETYYLATTEGDQPRVRPFGTVDLYEGKLYIQTGKIKSVSKQLHVNPKLEICAFNAGSWIRVEAEGVDDPSIEAKKHMLEAYPSLKGRYSAEDGNTEVWWLKNAVATISSFESEPRVIKF